MKADRQNRVIMHCRPNNLIAISSKNALTSAQGKGILTDIKARALQKPPGFAPGAFRYRSNLGGSILPAYDSLRQVGRGGGVAFGVTFFEYLRSLCQGQSCKILCIAAEKAFVFGVHFGQRMSARLELAHEVFHLVRCADEKVGCSLGEWDQFFSIIMLLSACDASRLLMKSRYSSV